MLRRKPLDIAEEISTLDPAAEPEAPSGIERRRHPRVSMDPVATPPADEGSGIERRRHPRVAMAEEPEIIRTATYTGPDRRMADRRGLNGVQADVPWTVAKAPARRGTTPFGLSTPRLMLLGVAILAGGAAAFMVASRAPDTPPVPVETPVQIVQEARAKVLIATDMIAVGQRVTGSLLSWQDWPQGALRADYVTLAATPEAMADYEGQIARNTIFPGEPIRAEKLVSGSSSSFLALMLKPGHRAVAVGVSPGSASGGFIGPDDHVDVLYTRPWGNSQIAETILRDIRVLAIDGKFGDAPEGGTTETPARPDGANFGAKVLATLELDPVAAEVLTRAEASGQLTLALRAATDNVQTPPPGNQSLNAAIRLSSPFWAPPAPQSPPR